MFQFSWTTFFSNLESWEKLAVPVRRTFIHLNPEAGLFNPQTAVDPQPSFAEATANSRFDVEQRKTEMRQLVAAGFLESGKNNPGAFSLHSKWLPFLRVLRFLEKYRISGSAPTKREFHRYADALLSHAEQQSLAMRSRADGETDLGSLNNLTAVRWLDTFLDETKLKHAPKLAPRHLMVWGYESRANFPLVTPLARNLVAELRQRKEPVPFRELSSHFPGTDRETLGAAVQCALNWMALIASLRTHDWEPILGVWPGITRRLFRLTVPAPAPVEPETRFHAAFLMEDATAALVACSEEPFRLRQSDGVLFAKSVELIAARLARVPEWVNHFFQSQRAAEDDDDDCDSGFREAKTDPLEARVKNAVWILRGLKFVESQGGRGYRKFWRLEITPQGRQWLETSAQQRLKTFLDRVVADVKQKSDRAHYRTSKTLFQSETGATVNGKHHDILELLRQPLLACENDAFLPIKEFIGYHTLENNPLLAWHRQKAKISITYGWQKIPCYEETLEETWEQWMTHTLRELLLPLGCVEMGLLKDGRTAFRLREAGLYLFGRQKDFAYGQEITGAVVIQPNFDVVFLAPSVAEEAAISRLAERVSAGVGTLFRITKRSIFKAAAVGLKMDDALATLRRVSSKELPSNVERQVKDWFGACRLVRMRTVTLVECPDTEAVSRVTEILRGGVRPITPTLLEFTVLFNKAELLKKLGKNGVFLEPASSEADKTSGDDPDTDD